MIKFFPRQEFNTFTATLTLMTLTASSLGIATPATYVFDQKSSAGFTAVGKPGFLRINGEGGKVGGELILDGTKEIVKTEIKVNVTQLNSGIDLRDQHMKEKYLETTKFPEVIFRSEHIKVDGNGTRSEKTMQT